MKKLLLITTAFIPALLYAQPEKDYIEVRGESAYENVVEKYQSKISITATDYYTYEEDKATLEELEKNFFDVMEKNGFKKTQFTKSEEVSTNSQEKQVFFLFETPSKTEFQKFYQLKNTKGMAKYEAKTINKPIADLEGIISSALKDAKEKAAIIARAAGKDLGALASISDTYNTLQPDSYYPNTKENVYRIFVRFNTK